MINYQHIIVSNDPNEIGGLIDEDCIKSYWMALDAYMKGNHPNHRPIIGIYEPLVPEIRLKCKIC